LVVAAREGHQEPAVQAAHHHSALFRWLEVAAAVVLVVRELKVLAVEAETEPEVGAWGNRRAVKAVTEGGEL
jgi:hypothetical protein